MFIKDQNTFRICLRRPIPKLSNFKCVRHIKYVHNVILMFFIFF